MQSIKVVVVGDGAVGKTSFLISFTMSAFPSEYIPTVFDNFNAVYDFEGTKVFLGLWDTAGQQDFDKIRPMSYKEADFYLLFFSVVNPTSLENVKLRWVEEIKFNSPNIPYFLVGTQIDSREQEDIVLELEQKGKRPISTKEGQQVAQEIGAVGYFEISAREMQFGDIFDELIRHVINIQRGQKKKGKFCWSIHCRSKFTTFGSHKCKDCGNLMCNDCIEIWESGYKGCPNCSTIKRKVKEVEGGEVKIRKPRKSPEEKLKEQEEKLQKKLAKLKEKNKQLNQEDIEKMLKEQDQSSDHEDSDTKKKRKSNDD
jgi:Ras-related C3 botulinum toxin substrate 1